MTHFTSMNLNFIPQSMAKNLKYNDSLKNLEAVSGSNIPKKYLQIFIYFYKSYANTLKENHIDVSICHDLFKLYLKLIEEQCKDPYVFELYHKAIRKPFDYYAFGVN